MRKLISKDLQTAQGMVEFALVLPILLLVIFGIFAFGHLFFAYSSVVSASREAARWGSAVGIADADDPRPRYQNCEAIRDTAVRVGAFAGVGPTDGPDDENTPGIYIGFDHGPNDPDADYDDCSDDAGPNTVGYGDRINVRVTVQYETIVPLVNIPTFPLSATTSRTIVHNLPVGERPIADPACRRTTIDMDFVPEFPVVGEPINVYLTVIATDGTYPPGTVTIRDDSFPAYTCTFNVPGQTGCSDPLVPAGYPHVGTHYFDVVYDWTGSGSPCYMDQEIIDEPLVINKAETSIEITSHIDEPSWPGQSITVSFQVTVDPPGAGSPTGLVTVTADDGVNPATACTAFVDPFTGMGGCSGLFPIIDTTLTASYAGDADFNGSVSAPVIHLVHPPATVEPPPYCPFIVPDSFEVVHYLGEHGGQMEISNANGGDTAIDHIEVTWPEANNVGLHQIRFGPYSTINHCEIHGSQVGRNCLWRNDYSTNGYLLPPFQAINHTVSNWQTQYADISAGETRVLRLLFTDDLPSGDYTIHIHFDNNCTLDLTGDFAP